MKICKIGKLRQKRSRPLEKISRSVKSFDNITTKGFIPFIPKNIFVWNEIMVRDAMQAYGYYKPNIYAIGATQYDHAKRSNNLIKTSHN